VASAPDPGPAPGSAWTAGQVASYLGISESTLRTWHRRYGLDPDGARPGRYRRYRAGDIARLRRMAQLVDSGMLASEAARLVQGGEAAPVPPERDVADLAAAARALDGERCRAVFDDALARRGVADAWELVGVPALAAVDADQREDPACIDTEHTLSWALLAALNGLPRPPAAPRAARVLLACTDGELHTLPLAALAAALAEQRVPVRMLGAANPAPSLVRAVREVRPEVAVLWSQRSETADPGVLRALRAYPVRVVIAGPGWPASPLPGVLRAATLRAALSLLSS
jgi:DNA-binding transcriptional MerR regulator